MYPSRFWSVDTKPPLSRGWDSAGLKDRYKSSCGHSKWEYIDRHQCREMDSEHVKRFGRLCAQIGSIGIDQWVFTFCRFTWQQRCKVVGWPEPWTNLCFGGQFFWTKKLYIIQIEDPMDRVSSGHKVSYRTNQDGRVAGDQKVSKRIHWIPRLYYCTSGEIETSWCCCKTP